MTLRTPPGWTRHQPKDHRFYRKTKNGQRIWAVYYSKQKAWAVFNHDCSEHRTFGSKRNRALAFASQIARENGGWA